MPVLFPTPFYRSSDMVEVILATSRDMYTIHRPMGLTPIVSREDGFPGCIYSCTGMVDDGDGRWIHYFCPLICGHNEEAVKDPKEINPGFYRMIFREDGYCSLHAESHGGCITVPMQFGKRLIVNAELQYYGKAEFAVTDETGAVLDGFDFADCMMEKVNNVSYEVKWNKPLDSLDLNAKYRIKMKLFKCDIYSYTFLDCPDPEEVALHERSYRI